MTAGIFWDSLNATKENTTPSEYDILSCLSVDYSEDFEDFCLSFGYEDFNEYGKRNSDSFHIYKAVMKQSHSLKRIFTEDQLDQLHDIS